MGQFSYFGANKALDHVMNTAYTPAATLYVALCTADPTRSATGASMNEVSNTGNYARTAITFGAASSRRVTQSGSISFPTLNASLGTATHFAVVDSATYGAGNVLGIGALAASKQLVSGNTPTLASGEVYIEISAGKCSNYLSDKLLDFMFRNQAFTRPATYVFLTTATIADSNTGSTVTEPSGNAYARKQVNVNGGSSPTWTLASSGALENTHDITMATATGSWGTVVAAGVADASSAGNMLIYDNTVADQAVGNGDTVVFAAGAWDVSIS